MNKIFQLKSFIRYRFCSVTKHGVHSPFVFELMTTVFPVKRKPDYVRIEFLRSQLLKDNSIIETNDRGAGSKYKPKFSTVKQITKYSSVHPKRGALYYQLISFFKPNSILELGTSLGFSTMYMASANTEASLTTIEGCKAIADIAQQNFNQLGLYNINLIHGDFDTVLPKILSTVTQLDFVLIDGNHKKEPTLNYFNSIKSVIHSNSVIVFDDIHWSEEMQEAWETIKLDKMVTISIDLYFVGIVFFKSELTKQDFVLRY